MRVKRGLNWDSNRAVPRRDMVVRAADEVASSMAKAASPPGGGNVGG